jgi:hypothetical protein
MAEVRAEDEIQGKVPTCTACFLGLLAFGGGKLVACLAYVLFHIVERTMPLRITDCIKHGLLPKRNVEGVGGHLQVSFYQNKKKWSVYLS